MLSSEPGSEPGWYTMPMSSLPHCVVVVSHITSSSAGSCSVRGDTSSPILGQTTMSPPKMFLSLLIGVWWPVKVISLLEMELSIYMRFHNNKERWTVLFSYVVKMINVANSTYSVSNYQIKDVWKQESDANVSLLCCSLSMVLLGSSRTTHVLSYDVCINCGQEGWELGKWESPPDQELSLPRFQGSHLPGWTVYTVPRRAISWRMQSGNLCVALAVGTHSSSAYFTCTRNPG